MKVCTTCDQEKPLVEYYKCARWADGLQKQCKSCHKQLTGKHYSENSEVYISRANAQREEAQELVRFIKEEGACTICEESKWWRLAFHHIDTSSKELTLAKARTLVQVLRELPKCILVCHNCHADIHHAERMGQ